MFSVYFGATEVRGIFGVISPNGRSLRRRCICVGVGVVTTAVLLLLSPPVLHRVLSSAGGLTERVYFARQVLERDPRASPSTSTPETDRAEMTGPTAPRRQDTRKFVENLSGAGKSIAVLTSGGDAQGNIWFRDSAGPPVPQRAWGTA